MQPLFDPDLVTARKIRALDQYVDGADFMMERAVDDLAERLATVERKFAKAAAIGCLTGGAADILRRSGKVGEVVRIEAHERLLDEADLVIRDEQLPLEPESIDLAVSLLTFQEVNDLPGMLIQIRRALRPDGLFLAALTGGGTLAELRESLLAAETELTGGAAPRIAPFVDVRDAGGLLQRAGLALPVADIETTTVRYTTMFGLMADLRAMGATNSLAERSRRPATRRFFARAAQIYAERFADPDGRVRATFSTVWLSGWAPHASQPKALRPGSAQISLTKVLGNE